MHHSGKISLEDFGHFKELIWWTACKKTPFLIKGGVKDESYYLLITDMKTVWYRKGDKETVQTEKRKFNPAINTPTLKGILELLETPISSFDKQAEYKFQFEGDDLLFEINTIINIYPFRWEFYCEKVNSGQSFEIFTEDLVNPLLCSLKAMEMRVNLIKKQFQELEVDYLKRLNEKEKGNYRSKLEDGEDYWKFLVKENNLETKIADFDLDNAGKFFFKTYSTQKYKKIQENDRKMNEENERVGRKRKQDQITVAPASDDLAYSVAENYTEDISEINKKIELENKLNKKVDKKESKKTKMTFL